MMPDVARRKSYHHGNLRDEMVRLALEVVAREGIEALSLRSVAQAAGVSHAAPYAHFRDKEDLIAAVKDFGVAELSRRLFGALEESGRGLPSRVRGAVEAYVGFAVENPTLYRLVFERPLRREPRSDFRYLQMAKDLVDRLYGFLSERRSGVSEGARRRLRVALLSDWAAIHGACSLWINGPLTLVLEGEAGFQGLLTELTRNLRVAALLGAP